MPRKETSERVSAIAGRYLNIDGDGLQDMVIIDGCVSVRNFEELADDVATMAASCLSQDETPETDCQP